MLHVTGEDQAFDLKGALQALHFELRQAIVYRARAAQALDAQVVEAIASENVEGVVLMSPRTAAIFSDLAAKAGVAEPASRLTYFCLSEAVAKAIPASLAPSRVKIARLPKPTGNACAPGRGRAKLALNFGELPPMSDTNDRNASSKRPHATLDLKATDVHTSRGDDRARGAATAKCGCFGRRAE